MKKLTILMALSFLLISAVPEKASAQDSREEVLAVVAKLFEGMKARDGELLKSLFHPDATMTGTGMRDGSYHVTVNPPDGWIESISSSTGPEIDERFYNPKVEVSGPLASVWTEYDLFVGGDSATAEWTPSIWPLPTKDGRLCTLPTPG